jgi:hypothetical protein
VKGSLRAILAMASVLVSVTRHFHHPLSTQLILVPGTTRCCPSADRCCTDGTCVSTGQTCCSGGGGCAAGRTCCGSGCMPTGYECCGALSCEPNTLCCDTGYCAPKGGQCCKGGGTCGAGLLCVITPQGERGCCPNLSCQSGVSASTLPIGSTGRVTTAPAAAPTIGTVVPPQVTYSWYTTTIVWWYWYYYFTWDLVYSSTSTESSRVYTTTTISAYASSSLEAYNQFTIAEETLTTQTPMQQTTTFAGQTPPAAASGTSKTYAQNTGSGGSNGAKSDGVAFRIGTDSRYSLWLLCCTALMPLFIAVVL